MMFNKILTYLKPFSLLFVLIVIGLYAGFHFFGVMNPSVYGIANANGEILDSVVFAKNWQMTDNFMRVRMAVFGPIILICHIIALLLFIKEWRKITFWMITISLVLFICDIIFTTTVQFPINQYIVSLDLNHLTNDQVLKLKEMHPQLIKNFKNREYFSLIGFLAMSVGVVFRK
jgi:hypothetical protein